MFKVLDGMALLLNYIHSAFSAVSGYAEQLHGLSVTPPSADQVHGIALWHIRNLEVLNGMALPPN